MALTQPAPVYATPTIPELPYVPPKGEYQLYVIALETRGKPEEQKRQFYVGITRKGEGRLHQHVNGTGAEWTKGKRVYRQFLHLSNPIRVNGVSAAAMRGDAEQLEDLVTAQMMMIMGLNNVRGGRLVDRYFYRSDSVESMKSRYAKYVEEVEKKRADPNHEIEDDSLGRVVYVLSDVLMIPPEVVIEWVRNQIDENVTLPTGTPLQSVFLTSKWTVVADSMVIPPFSINPLLHHPQHENWQAILTQPNRWQYLRFGEVQVPVIDPGFVPPVAPTQPTVPAIPDNNVPDTLDSTWEFLWTITLFCVLFSASCVYAAVAYNTKIRTGFATANMAAIITGLVFSIVTSAITTLLLDHWSIIITGVLCSVASASTISIGTSRSIFTSFDGAVIPFFITAPLTCGTFVMVLLRCCRRNILRKWELGSGYLTSLVIIAIICMLGYMGNPGYELTYLHRAIALATLSVPISLILLFMNCPVGSRRNSDGSFSNIMPFTALFYCPATTIPAILTCPLICFRISSSAARRYK